MKFSAYELGMLNTDARLGNTLYLCRGPCGLLQGSGGTWMNDDIYNLRPEDHHFIVATAVVE